MNAPHYNVRLASTMVGIGVIALLVTLGIPALQAMTHSARAVDCENRLRMIAVSLHTFSVNDPREAFCSGGYDYLRDGCPDTYGWVADFQVLEPLRESEDPANPLLCPEYLTFGSATLNDLIGRSESPTQPLVDAGTFADRNIGLCEGFAADTDGDGKSDIGLFDPGSSERIDRVDKMVAAGYETNYVASWFLTRSKIRHDCDGNHIAVVREEGRVTDPAGSFGPMRRRDLETGSIPSNAIPFAADGGIAPGERGSLVSDFGNNFQQGDPLAETQTGGPIAWDQSSGTFLTPQPGMMLVESGLVSDHNHAHCFTRDEQINYDIKTITPPTKREWLQDTRQWGTPHSSGPLGATFACILMADGRVKRVNDLNGDGVLNPGFQNVGPGSGYSDSTVELAPAIVWSGPLIPSVRFIGGGFERDDFE
ncbi:DUF1559 domain-containing protein [Stratiformator vulcanicus]|uniref:Type II secretion system protein G n=1 Tax=Stratiformator vulcanicus TaxID=2527980 RepID=A0A517QXI4_9PLAN|nr:DUF1559 domain-containing protein [Stratiformator vulcanicus]QDT36351.1 hypothetical protein Pan189_07070 [Stratiformator vulcanicus]